MSISKPFISDPTQLEYLYSHSKGEMKHTLMNDFLSKYSFQKDLYALRGLLSALLNISIEDITDITILNPIEPGNNLSEKECILDINLELNHCKRINIEIQARYQDYWPERSITYLCRNFDNLKSGESYNLVMPCIHIGILTHDLFKKDDPRYTGDFYSEYRLLHTDKHTEYSSKFEIRVLSLSQLENASKEDKEDPNGLYRWAKLFLASSWEDLKMVAQDNTVMTSFVGTVMQLSAEEKVAQACEARRRWSNDVATYEEEIETARKTAAENKRQLTEVQREIKEAQKEIVEAKKQTEVAQKEVEEAKKQTEVAQKEVEEAKKQTVAAQKEAENAQKEAQAAQKEAENAQKEAQAAQKEAENAQKEAQTAQKQQFETQKQLQSANREIEELKKQLMKLQQ